MIMDQECDVYIFILGFIYPYPMYIIPDARHWYLMILNASQAIRVSLFSMTNKKVGCKSLVLARSPHAPPRLPWSRTRPRFLRLLWSALPITVVGSRQPYRIPGEVFHMKEQLKPCPMFETNPLLLCEHRHQVLDAASQTHCPGFLHHDGSPLGARRQL